MSGGLRNSGSSMIRPIGLLAAGCAAATALGFAIGVPWVLPALGALVAYPVWAAELLAGRPARGVGLMLIWALFLSVAIVAATEVEYVISLHPNVKEVAVIGVPDPIRDEAIMAVVILNPGEACAEQEIIDWCAERLAKFKVPSFVKFKGDFPRTSIGKVQKNIIRKEEVAAMEGQK